MVLLTPLVLLPHPTKPPTFAVKAIIPPSYAMSFPPVETLDNDDSTSPYEHSDLESAEPDPLLVPLQSTLHQH